MNKNIEAMVAELEREFPDSYNKELYLLIHAYVGVDDEFQEELFSNLFMHYKTSVIGISRDFENNSFDINTDILIEQEDLAILAKAMSIVAKHLSKINFKSHL
ncbi:hypothetical protein [Ligilactobacillus salivarius]|uniref:Uncharacterized protein n=1 Tax=Ligilactobacillus salivarius TaxID=1624 RepID=A0A1D7TSQ2_9LACO|nr:hypothetical protein [Ligilactobacillus salivarius]AOO73999.1 hypothetical protein BHF65_07140 [Ligilactobacillus salivarius]UDE97937.1 hypothetical protein LG631_03780 [Ligilactobacillus salivarius]UUV97054.1 hypothetical protein M3M92_03780 [Ligilactobacillus salivarius]